MQMRKNLGAAAPAWLHVVFLKTLKATTCVQTGIVLPILFCPILNALGLRLPLRRLWAEGCCLFSQTAELQPSSWSDAALSLLFQLISAAVKLLGVRDEAAMHHLLLREYVGHAPLILVAGAATGTQSAHLYTQVYTHVYRPIYTHRHPHSKQYTHLHTLPAAL